MDKKFYLSLLLELKGVLIVFSLNSIYGLLVFFVLHGLSSLILSYCLTRLILILKRQQNKKIFWALFFMTYFTGPAGMFLSFFMYLALVSRKINLLNFYETTSTENLPKLDFSGRKVGEGMPKAQNFRTVFYMSKFIHPTSTKFLKKTVNTDQDEIRLLAFSLLTNLEKNIIEKISLMKKQLEKTKDEREKFEIFYSLGELYWEIVYLNISDKELIEAYLKEALKYIQKALQIREEPKVYFILGRIYLKLGNNDSAQEAFYKSLELGFPAERILVYLMEILYYKRNFAEIFNILKKLKNITLPDPKTELILKVWR